MPGSKTTTITLLAKDLASGNINKVRTELGALGKSGTAVGGSMSIVSRAASGMGGALSHARSQVMGLVGNMGILAGGAGLLGVSGALEQSISMAQDFGAEVMRIQALTGGTVEDASNLAAAFDHVGISSDKAKTLVGFLEKNVGLLAAKKDGISKFEKQFSLDLTDTNGKIKSANDLVLTAADYYGNKLIPTTERAAAMSKLFGRSWQDLIPLLSLGRKGIADVQAEAASLGLQITSKNIPELKAMRDASRQWGDVLGGLKLQIGLAILPALTDLTKNASKFIADNRTGIVGGFKSLVGFAQSAAGAILSVGKSLASMWGMVPGPLKELLVGGYVANKAAGWLFGKSPLSLLTGGLGGLLRGGVGGAAQGVIGAATGTPVFVTNWPIGLGAGSLLPAAEGAGVGAGEVAGAGLLSSLLPVAAVALVTGGAAAIIANWINGQAAKERAAGTAPYVDPNLGKTGMRFGPLPPKYGTQYPAGTTPVTPARLPDWVGRPMGEHSASAPAARLLAQAAAGWAQDRSIIVSSAQAFVSRIENSMAPSMRSIASGVGSLRTIIARGDPTTKNALVPILEEIAAAIGGLSGALMSPAWQSYRSGERVYVTVNNTVTPYTIHKSTQVDTRYGGGKRVTIGESPHAGPIVS